MERERGDAKNYVKRRGNNERCLLVFTLWVFEDVDSLVPAPFFLRSSLRSGFIPPKKKWGQNWTRT